MPKQIQTKNTISNNFDPVICTRDVGPDLDLNSLQSEQAGGPNRCSFTVNTDIWAA